MAQHRDGKDHEEGEEGEHMCDPPDLMAAGEIGVAFDEGGDRVADEGPLLELRHAGLGDAPGLGAEPGHRDGEEHTEDHGVFGLGLDADAVRPLHIATQDGPHRADEQTQAGEITDE